MPVVLENISHAFGNRFVLKGINLSLGAGEGILLTGPNGSGKTTLLRIMAGLLRPFVGRVVRNGNDQLNIYLGGGGLFEDLTVFENLSFYSSLYSVGKEVRDEAIGLFDLSGFLPIKPGELSRGERVRASLAQTFLADVSLYLLDEPFSGLDEKAGGLLVSCIDREVRRGKTVLVASTDLEKDFVGGARHLFLKGGQLA